MGANRERSLYHGWVAVSYLMIAGSAALAGYVFAIAGVRGDGTEYAVIGLGAVLGGFFSGRLCPRKRLNEPATAGLALVATLVAFLSTTAFGPRLWEASTQAIVVRSLLLGGCALAGALVGAYAGHRTSPPRPHSSGWRWLGISVLLGLGTLSFSLFILFSLAFRAGIHGASESAMIATMFLVIGVAGVTSAAITQWLAPRRMPGAISLGGALVVMAVGATGTIADGEMDSMVILGCVLIGLILWGVGYGGARLGWFLNQRAARRVVVPDARAVDRHSGG